MHRRDVADKSGGTATRREKRREEREKKVGGDLEWRNVMGKEALRDYKRQHGDRTSLVLNFLPDQRGIPV
ncbi:hypothetical protein ACN38_g978 [Penicillium nordicum]|uniref:Uncharacterized protein n=1 Tax=Penicillium nordicum TaxID=229535 RepID=A0A0M8PCE3_9EURO|nr:hypothetical protein ACN38_g978 [Penicillium nordicum]